MANTKVADRKMNDMKVDNMKAAYWKVTARKVVIDSISTMSMRQTKNGRYRDVTSQMSDINFIL